MQHRKKHPNPVAQKQKKRAPGISRRLSGFMESVEAGDIRPIAGLLQDTSFAWAGMTLTERLQALWNISHSRTALHALAALERAGRKGQ